MCTLIKAMLAVTVVLLVLYWTLWFAARSSIASLHSEAYYQFENAFPLADAWLGVACLLALIALQRSHPTALLWLLCAGAAGVYLGSMDLLYDLEHGVFASGGGGVVELVIVVLTWLFSLVTLRWTWRNREQLLQPRQAVSKG